MKESIKKGNIPKIEQDFNSLELWWGYPLLTYDFVKKHKVKEKKIQDTRIPRNKTNPDRPVDFPKGRTPILVGMITSPEELKGKYIFAFFDGSPHPVIVVDEKDLVEKEKIE